MDRWQAAQESYSRVLAIKPDHGALEEFLNRVARTRLNAQASGPGDAERRPNRTSDRGFLLAAKTAAIRYDTRRIRDPSAP
jgi:hypothetical protein